MPIKIIAVPPGEAPLSVRERWIGIVIPTLGEKDYNMSLGVLGGITIGEYDRGYVVSVDDAIRALEQHEGPKGEATQWWKVWRVSPLGARVDHLIFAAHVCELVT